MVKEHNTGWIKGYLKEVFICTIIILIFVAFQIAQGWFGLWLRELLQ